MSHGKVQRNPKANVGKGHLLRSQNEQKGGWGGGEASFIFFFPFLCETFIIINSTSCKHQMSQTSATSAVSGRPPSAPWDICIHFLSPGSHCSPSICWRWLGSCLLGWLPHTVGFRLVILFIAPYILIGRSYFSCDFKRWSVSCGQ